MKKIYSKTNKPNETIVGPITDEMFNRLGIYKEKIYKLIYRNHKNPNQEVIYEMSGEQFVTKYLEFTIITSKLTQLEKYTLIKNELMPFVESWGCHYLKTTTSKNVKKLTIKTMRKYEKHRPNVEAYVHELVEFYMVERMFNKVSFKPNHTTAIVTDQKSTMTKKLLESRNPLLTDYLSASDLPTNEQNTYLMKEETVFKWKYPEDKPVEIAA